jgi:hypothetical protein
MAPDWCLVSPTGTLLQNGLHPQRLAGMVYSPLTRTWALSEDLQVNFIGCWAAPREQENNTSIPIA